VEYVRGSTPCLEKMGLGSSGMESVSKMRAVIKSLIVASLLGFGSPIVIAQSGPLQYTALQTPCRAVDTRVTGGPIVAGTSQSFNPAGGDCNIPLPTTGPIVYALNVTVVPHGPLGYLTVWPTGGPQPVVSTLNSSDGRVKANAAFATGGNGGQISVYASDTTDLVLDVSGYFTLNTNAYVYVPVTPCRLVDTRKSNGTFGAPSLVAGQQRTFLLANSSCNLPAAAFVNGGAVSLNVTAVPMAGQPVEYVTVWGTSETAPQTPLISTLNAPTGTVVANAAIVTITSDAISVFSSDNTDLVLDITGFFIPGSIDPPGLSLYTVPPCRALDTRESSGEFQGAMRISSTIFSSCGIPANLLAGTPSVVGAYVLNATVVPSAPLYLTIWPDCPDCVSEPPPLVSTLNSDGSVTSNMAIVSTPSAGADVNGNIDAFASSGTQLILDLSGYFAPPNLPPAPPALTGCYQGNTGSVNTLPIGGTAQQNTQCTYASGTSPLTCSPTADANGSIATGWGTTDSAVITVSETGLVTAVGTGTASATVSASQNSGTSRACNEWTFYIY
jgi:hypothetical protein